VYHEVYSLAVSAWTVNPGTGDTLLHVLMPCGDAALPLCQFAVRHCCVADPFACNAAGVYAATLVPDDDADELLAWALPYMWRAIRPGHALPWLEVFTGRCTESQAIALYKCMTRQRVRTDRVHVCCGHEYACICGRDVTVLQWCWQRDFAALCALLNKRHGPLLSCVPDVCRHDAAACMQWMCDAFPLSFAPDTCSIVVPFHAGIAAPLSPLMCAALFGALKCVHVVLDDMADDAARNAAKALRSDDGMRAEEYARLGQHADAVIAAVRPVPALVIAEAIARDTAHLQAWKRRRSQ